MTLKGFHDFLDRVHLSIQSKINAKIKNESIAYFGFMPQDEKMHAKPITKWTHINEN